MTATVGGCSYQLPAPDHQDALRCTASPVAAAHVEPGAA